MEKYVVDKKCILYDYLREIKNGSKNNIKNLLSKKYVKVNGKVTTKYDYELCENNVVEIGQNFISHDNIEIRIIYEDDDIIVLDKKANILTIQNEKDDVSLYYIVSNYVKKKNKNNKIFIVHRLDKDTSGVILFAKNEKVKNYLQDNWKDVQRFYKAIVYGDTKREDTIKLKLKETKTLYTYVSKDGKDAITKYKKIKSNDKYSLIDIEILTGRKNQIRVSLSHIGHSIVGDKKYGIKDKEKYMLLHAYKLEVKLPSKEKMTFESEIPNYFNKYINY